VQREGKNDALITLDFHNNGLMIGSWMAKAVGSGEGRDPARAARRSGCECAGTGLQGIDSEVQGVQARRRRQRGPRPKHGYTAAMQVLTAHPNLKGIYGLNDDIAMGIVRAVSSSHKEDQVKVAGHNGTCEAMGSILKGDSRLHAPAGRAAVRVQRRRHCHQAVEGPESEDGERQARPDRSGIRAKRPRQHGQGHNRRRPEGAAPDR